MTRPCVLIIDDETNFLSSITYGLRALGFESIGAGTAAEGLELVRKHRPQAVLLDHRLPDTPGIDLIAPMRSAVPGTVIVMVSAHGDIPTAVEAVRRGAYDFVTKPFDLEDLAAVLRAALPADRSRVGGARHPHLKTSPSPGVVEISAVMRDLRATIAIVARSSARTILLLGPSGVGKGFTARAIHDGSARAQGPFTTVNCAALPAELLEAELFGVERGAFTGATQTRPGLVEAAEGGTLFLDEIGEMAPALQAKLLRFLEGRCYRRLGAGREHTADVRIVAASNRDLGKEVAASRFRADLFYRLNVVPIALPQLADRPEDVMPLAHHFAARLTGAGDAPITFTEPAAAALTGYSWPGNVRELANLIERLVILHPGRMIDPRDLPLEISGESPSACSPIEAQLETTERDILARALKAANDHKGRAAEALGISRHALKRRLKRLGLL